MSFKNYKPEISWHGHDRYMKSGLGGTTSASKQNDSFKLNGSLGGGTKWLMDIPSRDSINTDTRTDAERRFAIGAKA